jgi:UDP-glucose 4-epimerase
MDCPSVERRTKRRSALATRLAITGSGGYLAQQLITRLGSEPDVEFVLGLDIRPREPQVACEARFLRFDLTAPWGELRDLFQSHRINVAMHLAWQFNPIHDLQRHRQVDIEGSQNFFRAAAAAGLKRVIYTSSTTAYVSPGNPEQPPYLPEDTPVSGTPLYLYSRHKAEVDRIAQQFMADHPEIEVIVLRPSIILGPHTRNIVSEVFNWPFRSFPWVLQVRGADPPMQFLSEEDIGEILYRAVKSDARGIFNAAGDGTVRFSEVARRCGKKLLNLPSWIAYPMTSLAWTLHLAPFPSGLLDMSRYAWVADNTRLKQRFGYSPRLTSLQALESFVAARFGAPTPAG